MKSPLQKLIAAADAKSMTRMLEAADVAQRIRHTATQATVVFAEPPTSVNKLYVEVRKRFWLKSENRWILKVRRIKTKEYTAWHDAAVDQIKLVQRCPLVRGNFHIDWLFAINPLRDLDGHFKAGFDSLQAAGVIENDRLCKGITAFWSSDITGATATIRSA